MPSGGAARRPLETRWAAGAPAGGEQEGAGNQHTRDAGDAQRDEQRAPGATWAGECADVWGWCAQEGRQA